jgi:hypothetical protein
MNQQGTIQPVHSDPEKQGEIAARETPGPLLLLAGPGSGKTECLAMRLKWLIKNKSVKPEQVTVITFTNEAAKNMKERISNPQKANVYLETDLQPMRITTMHSLAQTILKEKLDAVGLQEGFSVVFEDNVRELLFQDAASLAGLPRKQGIDALSAKQEGELSTLSKDGQSILEWYDKILRSMNSIDFDDQLILACRVLEDDGDLLKKYREGCVHLLVDEYQDINAYQDKFIRLLAGDNLAGLYVVGDDDQSIYSFRGGSPKYIRDFERAYSPDGRVIRLSVCRRCPSNVIGAALAVVTKFNQGRLPKPKFDFIASVPGRVVVHNAPSQAIEAQKIAKLAAEAPIGSSTMILVLSSYFAKPIKRALEKWGLGYEAKTRVKLPGMRITDTAASWLADYKDNQATRVLMDGMCKAVALGVPSERCTKSEKVAAREKMLGRVSAIWLRTIGKQTSLYKALEAECRAVDKIGDNEKSEDDRLLLGIRAAFEKLKEYHSKPLEDFLNALAEVLTPWGSPTVFLDEIKDALDEAYGRRGSKSPGVIRLLSMGLAKNTNRGYHISEAVISNGSITIYRCYTREPLRAGLHSVSYQEQEDEVVRSMERTDLDAVLYSRIMV